MTKPKTTVSSATENATVQANASFTPFVEQLIAQYKAGMQAKKSIAREMRAIRTILESNGVDVVAMFKTVKQ